MCNVILHYKRLEELPIMAKELKFVLLLDCYGELLTECQKNMTELYYCEDLTLSEISEIYGITRQAVRDIIKRTERILAEYESKLGFAEKTGRMRKCFDRLNEMTKEVGSDDLRLEMETEINKGLELLFEAD